MPLLNEDRPERRTGFEEYIVHKELRLFSKLLIYFFDSSNAYSFFKNIYFFRESQFFERGLYNERMKWEIENAHKIHRIPPETLKLGIIINFYSIALPSNNIGCLF